MKLDALAEIIGIYMGDGNLGKYPRCQYLRIYFNPKQKAYIRTIKKLLSSYFNKSPYQRYRKDAGVVYLEISSKKLSETLGFPTGSKIKNKITIPIWIKNKKSYLKLCLRGIFDTDGCIYITGGKYKIVNFTSHNIYMLQDIYKSLWVLGFHPYINKRRTQVELGRTLEVKRFFDIIKPRNSNHYRFSTS